MNYKVMSMCSSIDYCKGWNDAVEAVNNKENIFYKTVSMCISPRYCNGWNDAVKEIIENNA